MRHIYFLLIISFFLGCSGTKKIIKTDDPLSTMYQNAVQDAATTERAEISKELVYISEDNPDLIWKDFDGKKNVLVLTWTSWNGYDQNVGQKMTLAREVWVTAVPQLKNFCTNIDSSQLILRLEQLLGLPPKNGKTKLVEMWVSPENLFRPCPDPEITDQECELQFSKSAYSNTDEVYVQWFNQLKSESYSENGYPWTRLGYTYDWNSNSSEAGLSEFVIKPGTGVQIKSVTPTMKYCNK